MHEQSFMLHTSAERLKDIQVTLDITDPVHTYDAYRTTQRAKNRTDTSIDWDRNWIQRMCPVSVRATMVLACMPDPQSSAVPSMDILSQDIR